MEAKNVIAFEYEKEGRTYTLSMPSGAPLGEAYEAASQFVAEMVRLINEHAAKNKKSDEPVEEEETKGE